MKRLYRDESNEMIAGVCSGIANYLDIDPTVVRLLFVLFFFLAGGGLWIYLVLWVIMPEHPNTKEKVVEVKEKTSSLKKMAAPKAPAASKPAPKKVPEKKSAVKTKVARKTGAGRSSSASIAVKKTLTKTPASKSAAGKKSSTKKPETGTD